MYFRKCSGYAAYPLLAVLLCVPSIVPAQDASSQQSSSTSQAQPSSSSSQQQTTPLQQQSQILREAQERVNARRKIRVRQIIQDTYSHQYEFSAGGGYLRFRPGEYLQHNNEIEWYTDITDYLHGNWGVIGQARGYYGSAFTGINPYSVYQPSISQYVFLGGPVYRFFKGQHWGWAAEGMAGVGHGNFGTGTNGLPPQYVGLYNDTTVLNISAGASVDYNLSPAVAFRLTPNVLWTNYNSFFQQNLGFQVGLVYRFGRQK